ncbi:16S rRNA (cytosine(967)-C(5))-methyltransferase RsmB [Guyparkeria hydrothermalis]|uniref:16S rRNA (cytosine(967)-C(5))-methyltransferase RsmB n=1 Tax=Guyparkeria hydrothermalis TaxID=923 RepID=UPI00202171E7|nr:16S rRNA (cytosine(967)-C(5))-methyltransferase RsmB [Guyparkeria hydrothermalis]MCL7745204.1 16S rRNA (cytosine(967)-C(5))-methyltransferase RsmB [Guyparkeria hydrothermalis]
MANSGDVEQSKGERREPGRDRQRRRRPPAGGGRARSPEALVAEGLLQVVQQGRSLDHVLPDLTGRAQAAHRSVIQAMSYEVLRHYEQLAWWRDQLLDRPLNPRAAEVGMLLLVGLERLTGSKREPSRVVNAAVHAARELNHNWATGLVNAVLRRAVRQVQAGETPLPEAPPAVRARLPDWLFGMLSKDWGEERAVELGERLATHPPMTLRVSAVEESVSAYLERLAEQSVAASATRHASHGVALASPLDVERLPGFHQGVVSVQDEAAQLVVDLMDLAPGQRVLDACCAPGGKTLAMLDSEPSVAMTAVDIDVTRLARVQDNLERAGRFAELVCADLTSQSIDPPNSFDRILADVPCSATGVIRRHPDIKRLRRPDDLDALVKRQREILERLWGLLRPGGRLVYATCSILKRENVEQVEAFLQAHPDAIAVPMDVDWGEPQAVGRQLFPEVDGPDGFYYAVLEKRSEAG